MRNVLICALGALFVSSISAAAPAFPGVRETDPVKLPIKSDRDDDKVFDDLEARLAQTPAGGRLSVIVRLKAPATQARIDGLERAVGQLAVTHRFSVVDGFAATVTKSQVRGLAALGAVAQVEHNSTVRALNDTAQSSFGVTEARADDPGLDGNGDGNPDVYSAGDLVAAVIDTGIDAGHLDLDEGKVLAFKDLVNGSTAAYDDNGHGTHVAATIAGDGDARADRLYKGVAPAGALVGVKVLNSAGSGTMANVTAGIDWVVQNKDVYGIEAINLSLGTSGCSDGTDSTSLAVNNAAAAGIVVAVAAGNSGSGTCTIGSPGAAASAVTVGAMADMGENGFKQAYFSSRGKTLDGRIKPDVSAPGVNVTSADAGTTSGYVVFSGTSMATPFAAGVALLMRDANGALTSQQVKDAIMQSAVDWGRGGDNKTAGSTGQDIDYGAGRLDAYAALQAAGAPLSSPPATPAHRLEEGTLAGTGAFVDYLIDVTDAQFPVAATLIHPSIAGGSASSPDFDLFLYNPSGAEVARAYTTRRQEELGYKPSASGTYRLRVHSFSGSGPYFVDISAGTAPPPPDTTPPTVSSVSPADGATGVATNANVAATFSEAMDKPATEAAFSLVDAASAPVPGTLSWSGNTLTFDPGADLAKGATYTARVAGGASGAKDTAGNALASDQVWSFTTTTVSTVTAFPSTTTIEPGGGTLRAGNATRLGVDDNVYYQVNSTTSGTRTSSWYGTIPGVSNALTSLKATYSGKNSRSCTQTVSLWNWSAGTWAQLDSRSVGTTEVLIANLTPAGTLADYVSGSAGSGDVRLRVRCTRSSRSFYASGDLMRIVYDTP